MVALKKRFAAIADSYGRHKGIAWLALALATVAFSAWIHCRAGYSLPHPWCDEPWYLWTSVELSETGHWASPSLRPGPALILSPLYAVVHAVLFKAFGVGLAVARWSSWTYMTLAYVAILLLLRRRTGGLALAAAVLVSWFAVGPSSIVAGNMGRPEAMVWMLETWACLALDRRKIGLGLFLAGLALNLHELGTMFYAGMVVLACVGVFEKFRRREAWRLGDFAWLAAAAAVFVACAAWKKYSFDGVVYAAVYREDESEWIRRLCRGWRGVWLGLGGLLGLVKLFRNRDGLGVLALGVMGMLPLALRNQIWYSVYEQQACGLLAVSFAWAAADLAGARHRAAGRILAGAVAAGMVWFACWAQYLVLPQNYPCRFHWLGDMSIDPTRLEYMTEEDIQAVSDEIARRVAGKERPVRVLFLPEADGMFFHGRLPDGVIPYQGVRTDVQGDVGVFRFSRIMEKGRRQNAKQVMRRYGWDGSEPFRTRDDTEMWFFVDRTASAAAPAAP